MVEAPGAFIGEFDALDGPKVTYAFEYFDCGRASRNNAVIHQLLYFVEGEALLGKSVASGLLHHEWKEYLNSVAAHVLTSNESCEERLLFQDSGCPCVGSFLFSIPDIVARGEKRRFCLIFLHPSYHELIARWDHLSSFVEVLLRRWTLQAMNRYQQEYDTLKNLEQLREESRRKPLRPFTQLLADPSTDDASCSSAPVSTQTDIFEALHCYFEIILPEAFSRPIPMLSGINDALHQDAESFIDEHLLLAQSSIDRVNVDVSDLPEGDVLLPRFAKQMILVDTEIVVKPLPVWLLQYLSDVSTDESGSRSHFAIHYLLNALFSGNQIIITGENARDCAGLGMSLAYVLPPTLTKVHLGSDQYRMPYESRILSFSQEALDRYMFAEAPMPVAEDDPSHVIKLYDMEADGIVHVRVVDGRIHCIQGCDQLRRAALRCQRHERNTEVLASPTTLENRIIALLKPYVGCTPRRCTITVAALQLVTTRLHQLVSEYAVRGRVYAQLFSQQEVEANNASLSESPKAPQISAASPVTTAAGEAFNARNRYVAASRLRDQRGSLDGNALHATALSLRQPTNNTDASLLSDGSRLSGVSVRGRSEGDSRIMKHAHLSSTYGKQFQNHHYVFSSFAPEDHAVLVFLGSS